MCTHTHTHLPLMLCASLLLVVYTELKETGQFEEMTKAIDEKEHSIEMQLPYIAKVMESRRGQFTIVPVLVGAISKQKEIEYGRLFSKYLANPENIFVISSDFCHWGNPNLMPTSMWVCMILRIINVVYLVIQVNGFSTLCTTKRMVQYMHR